MFNRLRDSAKCCFAHSYATTPDELGNSFIYLQCQGCKDKNFCLKIKRVLEEELNTINKMQDEKDSLELDRRLGK